MADDERLKNDDFKSTDVFKLLIKKERNYETLNELNSMLSNNCELASLEDFELGTYLHLLTQTARAYDEYDI